jgi:putative chitinase
MSVTKEQLALIMPQAQKAGRVALWHPFLDKEMAAHAINTPLREAMFLATVAEETGELAAQVEASYYSTPWERIASVFGAGKPGGVAGLTPQLVESWRKLGRQGFDEAFFNHVYSDHNRPPGYRVGNVNPGDGWKYVGRGPMGLTGKQNYQRFFKALGMDPDSDPALVSTPEIGAKSAAHFWQANGCNEIADTGDFWALTKRVNGTHMNMNLRLPYYQRATAVLAAPVPPVVDPPPGTVRDNTGNVKIKDINQSTIIKDSNKGSVVATAGAAAGAAAPVVTALGGLDWRVAVVLAVVVIAAIGGAIYYFTKVKRARRKMHTDGWA